MITRRSLTRVRSIFLLLILATSVTHHQFAAASSSAEPTERHLRNNQQSSNVNSSTSSISRWLSHSCNSKNKSKSYYKKHCESSTQRRHFSRLNRSTTNEMYDANTSRGSNTFVNVAFGILAGVVSLLGLLFLIDRETFAQVTGVKKVPYYCDCSKYRIEDDEKDNDISPYERDMDANHLTPETQEYLDDKREAKEKPFRIIKSMWRSIEVCINPKKYDVSDKYQVPYAGSSDEESDAGCAAGNVSMLWVFWEDLRLRFCWRPTKVYDDTDKYSLGAEGEEDGEEDDAEIKVATSSYESAEKGTAPW